MFRHRCFVVCPSCHTTIRWTEKERSITSCQYVLAFAARCVSSSRPHLSLRFLRAAVVVDHHHHHCHSFTQDSRKMAVTVDAIKTWPEYFKTDMNKTSKWNARNASRLPATGIFISVRYRFFSPILFRRPNGKSFGGSPSCLMAFPSNVCRTGEHTVTVVITSHCSCHVFFSPSTVK